MKNKYVLFVFSILLLIPFGCRKDSITDEEIFIVDNPDGERSVAFKGQVVGVGARAISDALVSIGNQTTMTDANGFFSFKEAPFNNGGSLVKVEKAGYIIGLKRIVPNMNGGTFTKIGLIEKGDVAGQFDSQTGGSVSINNLEDRKVDFKANTIRTENGNDFSGNVNVFMYYYQPGNRPQDFFIPGDIFTPGNLDGITAENGAVRLQTFGMMYVELLSDGGEKLNLKEGATAEISFPFPDNAPDVTTLWSLNEDLGIWLEEGKAIRDGDVYKAEVSHFSFWNCDDFFELINLSGTLTNLEGTPLVNERVILSFNNGADVGYGFTNELGVFSGKVPKDQIFEVSIWNGCDEYYPIQTIGPFSADVVVPPIAVEADKNELTIIGLFKNCQGENLSNGYLKLTKKDSSLWNGGNIIMPISEDGTFETSLFLCNYDSVSIQVVDAETLESSPVYSFGVNDQDTIDLGVVSTCETLDEYLIITQEGIPFVRDNPVGQLQGSTFSIRYLDMFADFSIKIDDPAGAEPSANSLLLGFFDSPALGCNNYIQEETCNNIVTTTIDNYQGLGGYAEGRIEGQVYQEGFGLKDILIEFRVLIEFEQVPITGIAWLDENGDGIRQNDEAPMDSVSFLIGSELQEPDFTLSDENGLYTLYANPGIPLNVSVIPKNGFLLTTTDVGGDDTVDSDFNGPSNSTNSIDVIQGQPIENVDAGFVVDASQFCAAKVVTIPCPETAAGCVSVSIIGYPPNTVYTINIGGIIQETVSTPEHTICGLTGGVYEITVTFPDNQVCIQTVIMQPTMPISFSADFEMISCDPSPIGQYTITAQGGTSPYQYFWSTGQTTNVVQLPPGPHTLTIIDAAGCTKEFILDAAYNLATISGFAWRDDAGDNPNVFDMNDILQPNVTIDLNTEFDEFITSVKTDENGEFTFEGLTSLDLNQQFYLRVLPINFDLVDQDVGGDDTIDSDADPISKVTDLFTIEPGCFTKNDFGFGLIPD